ncbi:MAG: phosphodiesterase [Clostridia bacterium]|nr:phosphodiesterase [Clostridia bacterium]
MIFVIASDIHGSAFYLKKLLEAYKKEHAEKLILLGDILYHGPRNNLPNGYDPKEVISLLNDMKDEILCVRGNCDAEVDQMVLEFPIMADYALLRFQNKNVFATHGHKYNTSNLPPMSNIDILLHGHTHVPVCEKHDGFIYCNPGSISIPKGNSTNSYMIYDGENLIWKSLDGEIFNSLSVKG